MCEKIMKLWKKLKIYDMIFVFVFYFKSQLCISMTEETMC